MAVCASSLSPAVGILPVVPLPERGIVSQQGCYSSRPRVCPWEQQGPEPTVPFNRALQGKTHQVRDVTPMVLLSRIWVNILGLIILLIIALDVLHAVFNANRKLGFAVTTDDHCLFHLSHIDKNSPECL